MGKSRNIFWSGLGQGQGQGWKKEIADINLKILKLILNKENDYEAKFI